MTNIEPKYSNSHALIIGINEYTTAPPLGYAVNDAKGMAQMLESRFAFSKERITVLKDKHATRENINEAFLSLASNGTELNDRVIFFFAGHGHTIRSMRGDVGYLVPHDGDIKKLSSLIRWDELTRNADLIEAKHLLFLMDACYGGLAFLRSMSPGAVRFRKDMMMRRARQVLTAGKADEQVSDAGGPIPEHSVFTGHLLEALQGKAANTEGYLTANGIMAYVYHMVAHDRDSRQTPHYGNFDGDGDMILSEIESKDAVEEKTKHEDVLISIPAVLANEGMNNSMSLIETSKQLLSDDKNRIALHDFMVTKTREALSLTAEDNFPVQGNWSEQEMADRLKSYEEATEGLRNLHALVSHWGSKAHKDILTLPIKRLSERLDSAGGIVGWVALRWYPLYLLFYQSGIAALASDNYSNLLTMFTAPLADLKTSSRKQVAITGITSGISRASDGFRKLPGHEKNFVPLSEYIFRTLQPTIDDLFFVGADYEPLFDRFEVFLALEHSQQYGGWGPVGRFGYKYRHLEESSPFHRIIDEAKKLGDAWAPIKAGLFGGTIERFNTLVGNFQKERLDRLGWF